MQRFSLVVLIAVLFISIPLSAKDPADYPLAVYILRAQWNRDRFGVHHGWGRGNIKEGESIHGFDYTFEGCTPLNETVSPQHFPAKWKRPQLELQLLVPEVGKVDRYATCNLQVTVTEGVYLRGPAGISSLSQEQFKNWRARRAAAEKSDFNQYPVPPPAVAHVSIASIPAGADIQVDGKFLGNTPSVLDLPPGDHQITVRKNGYREWSRKMTLVSGNVNLNAELEQGSTP